MKKVSSAAKYQCSDGKKVSQATINKKLSETRKKMLGKSAGFGINCQAYPGESANDFDHTISQKRCKELGKTELIWSQENIAFSSRQAHKEWESYKSGMFEEHSNVIERMLFVKKHDREGFEKRMQNLSNYKLQSYLRSE